MKTLQEVIDNYSDYEVPLQDRFFSRFIDFLNLEQISSMGFDINQIPESERSSWKTKEWTRENVLSQLKEDVDFGFEKALSCRGISANLMFEVVRSWNKVLEEGLENWNQNDYAMYGLPLFKATAVKYGWENPIGDDTGKEEYYGEEDMLGICYD